jgi:hypothetical protein
MLFYRYILLNFACKILDYLIFLYLCFMQFSEILGQEQVIWQKRRFG